MRVFEKAVMKLAPYGSRRWRVLTMAWRSLFRGEAFRVSQLGMDHVLYRMTPRPIRRLLHASFGIGRLQFWRLRAGSAWHRLSRKTRDVPKGLLQGAEEALNSGKLMNADSILRTCLKEFPFCSDAYRQLARVQAARGDYSDATRTLLTALVVEPRSPDTWMQLASIYLSVGTFWEGEEILVRLLKDVPDHSEAILLLADLSMSQAKYEKAAGLYRRTLHLDPDNIAARHALAECIPANSFESKVSVVIPVWNQLEHTRKCLESLREAYPNMEVIVVDNNSLEPTAEYLQSQKNWIRVLRNESNLGFVKASNQGADCAGGDFLLFLNNDAFVKKGAIEALLRTAESDDAIGAVGAKLLYPSGDLQEAGGIVFSDGTAWNYGKGDDLRKPEYNYLRDTAYCSGACLLVRKEIFRSLGGFDERFAPAYYEDTDLAFALRKAGFRVVYQPEAEVLHAEGATAGTDVGAGFKQFQVIHAEKFKEKWSEALRSQPAFRMQDVRNASNQNARARILVIDHFLPIYDRSSGEQRAYQLLKLLKEEGHDVTYIARHGEYQFRYQRALQQLGVEVYATDRDRLVAWDYVPEAPTIDFEDLLNRRQFSLAILSRYQIAQVYMPILRKYDSTLPILVDSVDIHFLRERRKAQLYGEQELRDIADTVRFAEMSVYKQAQGVIVVTEEEKSLLESEGLDQPVFVVPNIHPVLADIPRFKERKDLLFVGNFIHPPNSDAAIYLCSRILPRIREELPNIQLFVVGANSFSIAHKLRSRNVIVTGYVPSTAPFLRSCRVSVAPLRYGAGMKGKIGESMASGLPVVTTSIGAEGMKAQPGVELLVEEDVTRFADAVVRVYTNEALWNQISRAGRLHMEEHYTPARVKPVLQALIASLIRD